MGAALPQTSQEVNQDRVGPSHNNGPHKKGALLLCVRGVPCVDMKQQSGEESFTDPASQISNHRLSHARDNQTLLLTDTCQATLL